MRQVIMWWGLDNREGDVTFSRELAWRSSSGGDGTCGVISSEDDAGEND